MPTCRRAWPAWALVGLGLSASAAQSQDPPAPQTPPAGQATGQRAVHLERTFGAMGTEVTIEAIGPDEDQLKAALGAAEAELRRVEDEMTTWRDSPLTRLNAKAGEGAQAVSLELAQLVQRSIAVGHLTGGAFDVTYASAGRLWDYKSSSPRVPAQERIDAVLARVDFSKVAVTLDPPTVSLPAGFQLGLGGVAKGYGVDRAMAVLIEHGVQHGMVNAGGDLKVLGNRMGRPWRIAIRHPRTPDAVLAMVPLANTCMVTSGDYERFFEIDGVRYHHILDPRTGRPATGAMSATVLAPDAAMADALATALVVLGPEKGLELVQGLERVECLIVDLGGQLHVTAGLRGLDSKPNGDR